ncbi:hypothetical protein PR202_ga04266 [Eleusine coracana subsp. coracana]|uniref:Uncharacterized protein n=1 Tax=Eleusine coracana subsp. coracana TaxID=191504 RepID=A0AAV5BRU6_ELECO|nr:hypothetical protein PR202_ga04266 [Eleusine coracana subsp. coracana]
MQQGLNSAIIRGAWMLWRHRDDCNFNGVTLSIVTALVLAGEETNLWCMTGAKALSSLIGLGGCDGEG